MNNKIKILLFALSVALIGAYAWQSVKAAANAGGLIKASGSSVYYVGADGKRYVFPNEKTYFSWYADFSSVKTISDSELASYPIGGNVTYRPGTRLIKIQSDPKVYAVSAGGVLRLVPDEAAAAAIYGADWNKMIDDISDAFFVDYKIGADISSTQRYDRTQEVAAATSIGTDKKITSLPASSPNNTNQNSGNISSGGGGGGSSMNTNSNSNTITGTGSGTVQLIGRDIKDAKGATFVGRGAEMVVADTYDIGWIDEAANDGANAVRLLLTVDAANNMTPATFDTLVGRAVSHNMIVWISLYSWDDAHNNVIGSALGGGNFYSLTAPAGTGTCSKATPTPCYLALWSRTWLKDLVAKYKGNVIIDGMQEYIGVANPETENGRTEWADVAKTCIQWFRGAGYVAPIEIMSNFQGRDLYAIVQKAASIRAADTVTVNGDPQTMFGWQAYWADPWYKSWQGEMLLGSNKTITGAQAIHQIVVAQNFPIEVGVDNYGGDTASEYQAEINQAAADNVTWLWWSWGGSGLECPVDGAACQAFVTGSPSGFAGAVRSAK